MALSEIEKLERRYAENPQGLTFAPLAEVHRKNGDVARALELLRSGLTLHPDYIPASIVLGRCHLDLGDLPAGEAAFTHVLSLDGENVIALKSLADITERQSRFDESERWLRTLIAVDRSNDEARDQLGRVEASRRQAEVASSASPNAASAPVVGEEPAVEGATTVAAAAETATGENRQGAGEPVAPVLDLEPQPEPTQDPMFARVEGSGSTAAAEPAPLELEELDPGVASDAAPPAGIEIEQPVSLDEPVEPLSGLVGRDDREQGPDLHVTPDEWQVETAEDIVLESAGGGEFQVANAAEELLSAPSVRDPEPLFSARPAVEREDVPAESAGAGEPATETREEPAPTSTPRSEPIAEAQPVGSTDAGGAEPAQADGTTKEEAGAKAPAWAAASWAPPVAEPPRRSEPDLVVTESMAELLLQQGHTMEALTVYRHLEERTADVRFREKIAELERMKVPAVPASAPAAAAMPTSSYSVRQTQGQSVQSFLRGVLGARPPAQQASPAARAEAPRGAADAAASGAPTRPAHDSLSLSSVFGEESTPTPPAVSAGGAAGAPGQGGVSYDEFFGAAGSGPTRPSRTPDPKSDDLDQFHAWLQNLKR